MGKISLVSQSGNQRYVILLFAMLIAGSVTAAKGRVSLAEEEIFLAINQLPGWLNPFFQLIMQVGTLFFVAVLSVLAWTYNRRRLAMQLLVGGIATWVGAVILKELIARERPIGLLNDVITRSTTIGYGFPSLHTALAALLATVLFTELPNRYWQMILILVVVLVGAARIYVGVHLPLDVVGGAALGVLVGLGVRHTKIPSRKK